jgi:hypothetical protein
MDHRPAACARKPEGSCWQAGARRERGPLPARSNALQWRMPELTRRRYLEVPGGLAVAYRQGRRCPS